MARKRPDSLRKVPTQARAQATVDAILRAAAHILRTQGWDACNTNAVAKKAGVSIGSLYQYFPSKDALITLLTEQHATRAHEVLINALASAAQTPMTIQVAVRTFIRATVLLHAEDPQLHRVLQAQVPRLESGFKVVRHMSSQSARLVRGWLELQREHLRDVDLDVATLVLVTAVESISHLDVLDKPRQLDTEVMVEELSWLVLGYLGIKP